MNAAATRVFVHERLLRCPYCACEFEPRFWLKPVVPGQSGRPVDCERCGREFYVLKETITTFTSPAPAGPVPPAGMVPKESLGRVMPPVQPTETNGRRS